MTPNDPQGWVALVLATGAALAVILLAVLDATHPGHLTEGESTVLSTALGAMIGAAATYLGGHRGGGGGEHEEPPPP